MENIVYEVNEKATFTLEVVVTDYNGNAVTPTVATYTLTDRDGAVINSREDVSITPAESMIVNLAGDDLQIINSNNDRELRIFTVKTDRGDAAKPETIESKFWVKNLKAVT